MSEDQQMEKSKDASCALEGGSEEKMPKEGSQHVAGDSSGAGDPQSLGI